VGFNPPVARVFVTQKAKANYQQPLKRIGAFLQRPDKRMVRRILANLFLDLNALFIERFQRQRHHAQLLPGRFKQVRQGDFGRNVAFDDYRRVHRDEVHLCHVHVQPHFGLVDHPAAVGLDQLHAAFECFHLAFLIRHQHIFFKRRDDLHGGDALPWRNARGFFDGQRGDTGHFKRAS